MIGLRRSLIQRLIRISGSSDQKTLRRQKLRYRAIHQLSASSRLQGILRRESTIAPHTTSAKNTRRSTGLPSSSALVDNPGPRNDSHDETYREPARNIQKNG